MATGAVRPGKGRVAGQGVEADAFPSPQENLGLAAPWRERTRRLRSFTLPEALSTVSATARARYSPRCDESRLRAAQKIAAILGIDLSLGAWSHRASEAWRRQWSGSDRRSAEGWDWDAIHRRYHNEVDRLDLAMWVGDRLCGLALTTLSGEAATVRFLEGSPRQDCPLIGYRALVAIESAQNYAQLNGKREIRVQPVTPPLEELYRDIFGFVLATPSGQEAYYRREIP